MNSILVTIALLAGILSLVLGTIFFIQSLNRFYGNYDTLFLVMGIILIVNAFIWVGGSFYYGITTIPIEEEEEKD